MKFKPLTLFFLVMLLMQCALQAQLSPKYIFGDDHGAGWNWGAGTQASPGAWDTYKWTFQSSYTGNHYFKFGNSQSPNNGQGFWMSGGGDVLYNGAGAIWTAQYSGDMGSSGAYYINTVSGKYYVVKSKLNSGGTNADFSVMELSASPVTIQYATDNYKQAGLAVEVTINLGASPCSEEKFFVRYTTDNWATSSFTEATGSGTTYKAIIPGQSVTGTANNTYYILSTTVSSPSHATADMITINSCKPAFGNYRLFSKEISIDVKNILAGDPNIFMVASDGSCTTHNCPNPYNTYDVRAYMYTGWSESNTTHNKFPYPCWDCAGATGIGAVTTTRALSVQTNLTNDTAGFALKFSTSSMAGFQTQCPVGDIRIYAGFGGELTQSGIVKLKFTDYRFVLHVPYNGGSISGSSYAGLDTVNSDPQWLAEFDPNHTGQVLIDFQSFSAVIQQCFGSFNSVFRIRPSSMVYHQSFAQVPHQGPAINNIVPLPTSNVSFHFSSATFGGGNSNYVYANEILAPPGGSVPSGIVTVSSSYWELSTTLSAFVADITFDLRNVTGMGDVSKLRIFRRANNLEDWIVWSDFTLVDATHIRANNVTSLGEWAIGTSKRTLQLKALIQGFYDSVSDSQIPDTVSVYLRRMVPPAYMVIDSAVVNLGSDGSASPVFTNTNNDTSYFIALKHKSSVETWSDTSKRSLSKFTSASMTYSFVDDSSKAYGSNLVKAGSKWCLLNGDINQDGQIEASDLILVDTDNLNFVTGYTPTDINGDGQVEASDLILVDTNNLTFISKITPAANKRIYLDAKVPAKTTRKSSQDNE